MSHFTVLVIGDDPEGQLEAFDENLETEPRCEGPVSEDDIKDFIDSYTDKKKEENASVALPETTLDQLYAEHGQDWNGNTWKKHDDGLWYEYSTSNPQAKWDWYSLGGRWTGFFKLKEGAKGKTGKPGLMTQPGEKGWVDQALKRAIDFEGMRDEAARSAAERYENAMAIIGHLPANETWETMRERADQDSQSSIDRAREEYWAQPRCEAWRNQPGGAGFGSSPDEFLISKEEYVQKARDRAISTFALLKNGEWFEKGEMGWFGMSTDKMTQDEWNKKVTELIDGLPEDTLFSLYDCHI